MFSFLAFTPLSKQVSQHGSVTPHFGQLQKVLEILLLQFKKLEEQILKDFVIWATLCLAFISYFAVYSS